MKYTTYILFALIISFSISSCKKGCKDTYARNYDISADVDDGSCFYGADVIFWVSNTAHDYMENNGIGYVSVNINDVFVSFMYSSVYSYVEPDCDDFLTEDYYLSMEGKTQTVTVKLYDESDSLVYSNSYEITSGRCNNVELFN